MRVFLRQLRPAIVALLMFTILTGLVYPMVITGFAQLGFKDKANGSLVSKGGVAVGSSLIGQAFTDPIYLHPRPSAAGTDGYDGSASSGSNLGPTNTDFLTTVAKRVTDYRTENQLSATQLVPVDAVTASASGLDPLVSIANARLQVSRIAAARHLSVDKVLAVVAATTTSRPLGMFGDVGVNVLQVNLALDSTT